MSEIPLHLEEWVKTQNGLNALANQVQQELYNLALPFVGKKVVNCHRKKDITQKFRETLGDVLNRTNSKQLIYTQPPHIYCIIVVVELYHQVTDDYICHKRTRFSLGQLKDGVILKSLEEPTVRDTNISYEEILKKFKRLEESRKESLILFNELLEFSHVSNVIRRDNPLFFID
jgi:hypothetical protein